MILSLRPLFQMSGAGRRLACAEHTGPPDGPHAESKARQRSSRPFRGRPTKAQSNPEALYRSPGGLGNRYVNCPRREILAIGCHCGPGATVAAELPQEPAANSGDRHLGYGPCKLCRRVRRSDVGLPGALSAVRLWDACVDALVAIP